MLPSLSPPLLHREVKGEGFSALLAGTSAGEMLNFSWAWSWTFHVKDSFPRPPFCLFFFLHGNLFDLKRVVLINIHHACFSTLYSLKLDSTHSLRETGPSFIQTPESFTVMRMITKPFRWSLSLFSLRAFVPSNFSVSVLICPRPLFNCVLHAALKWTWSCQNSLEWVPLINITAKPPSRVQKINGLQFFPEGKTFFFLLFFWGGGWVIIWVKLRLKHTFHIQCGPEVRERASSPEYYERFEILLTKTTYPPPAHILQSDRINGKKKRNASKLFWGGIHVR